MRGKYVLITLKSLNRLETKFLIKFTFKRDLLTETDTQSKEPSQNLNCHIELRNRKKIIETATMS